MDISARSSMSNSASMPSSWLLVLLLTMTVTGSVWLFYRSLMLVSYDGDVTYPESTVVRVSLWAAETGRLYPGLQTSPYTPAPYGPLLYLGLAALARIGSWGFDQLLVAGRLISLLFFALTGLLAYRWCRREGLRPTVSALSSLFLFSQFDFLDWNVTVRPDMLSLLLVLAALYLISGGESYGVLVATGLCLGGAVLFKQGYFAAAVATGIWLISRRRFISLMIVAGSAVFPVAVTLAMLIFRREPVLQEVLAFRSSILSFPSALILLKNDFLRYPTQGIYLSLALLGLWVYLSRSPAKGRLLILYFALAWAVGIYTAAAPGASVNAMLETWTLCSLLAPFAVEWIENEWSHSGISLRAFIMLSLLWSFAFGLDAWRTQVGLGRPKGFKELAMALKGREYLSDNSYLAAQASIPELLDPAVNHYMELAGLWKPRPIVEKLEARYYDAVLLGLDHGRVRQWRGFTLFSRSILTKVEENYKVACLARELVVLLPRDDPRHSREEILSSLEHAGCEPVGPTLSSPSLLDSLK